MNKILTVLIVTYWHMTLLSGTTVQGIVIDADYNRANYDNPASLTNFIDENDIINSVDGQENVHPSFYDENRNALFYAMIEPHPNLFRGQKENNKSKQQKPRPYRPSASYYKRYAPQAFHAMRGKRTVS
ncbi:unnamed protein product [Didymodactylos carnosus]|uniref:Uncharacterized protein n=1 Tax=Didymodactylos carnosus TaxID=1234261 RepID=A0A814U0L8_9BILA|nr:unnamed protein product [Didymodactylos carnosus]CAF1211987.1 unnamed protein product [Didymodactylos carnosus]CAF3931969.1 unnamed protein product [Didymodactylos carnosus]CAF4020900.1 unnamed protein product [Didymodactylos carnosus]